MTGFEIDVDDHFVGFCHFKQCSLYFSISFCVRLVCSASSSFFSGSCCGAIEVQRQAFKFTCALSVGFRCVKLLLLTFPIRSAQVFLLLIHWSEV